MDKKKLRTLALKVATAEAAGNQREVRRLGAELFEALVEEFIEQHGLETFEAELPGILAWAVEGAAMYGREGLTPPEWLMRSRDN